MIIVVWFRAPLCVDGTHTPLLFSPSLLFLLSSSLFSLYQLCFVLLVAAELQCGGAVSALPPPSRVPVQEIGIKARHELICPAGQTAHYNAQQGPTAGVKRAQYLLIICSFALCLWLPLTLTDFGIFLFLYSFLISSILSYFLFPSLCPLPVVISLRFWPPLS